MKLDKMINEQMIVSRSIVVNVPQVHAFEVFTRDLGRWWPLASHHIGAASPETAIIEPKVGGRWFERASDGTECDWGRVLEWDPPKRLVLSWDIGADWKSKPNLGTEVEILFLAESSETTRVEVTHRYLERYGLNAEEMKITFGSSNGWSGILKGFAGAIQTQNADG